MIGCRTKESGNGSMKIIEFQVCNCFVELSLGAPKGTNSQAKGDWGLFQAHSRILSHPVINSSTTMMTGVWLWQTGGYRRVEQSFCLSGFSSSVKQIHWIYNLPVLQTQHYSSSYKSGWLCCGYLLPKNFHFWLPSWLYLPYYCSEYCIVTVGLQRTCIKS